MLLVKAAYSFTFYLLVVSFTAAPFTAYPFNEDSLLCSGTGTLVFQGDGRFSIVRESGSNGSLICDGEVSIMVNSALYTRIISEGKFVCNSSSSVRICGYGDTELIASEGPSSLLQCNGELLGLPAAKSHINMYCLGNGNFSVRGLGNYIIEADAIACIGDAAIPISHRRRYDVVGRFYCFGLGPYTISGYGQLFSVSSQSGNCSNESFPTIKYCSGTGEYSLVGEGNYKISTVSGNISCFGDVTSSDYIKTTFGPFCCQGNDTFNLNGTGFLYNVMASYFNNCSSLIDNTPYVSYDSHTTMLCNGTGANAFVGNGDFKIKVNGISSNIGLKCDGSVSHIYYTDNGALYTELNGHSYGQFRCIASGYVSINGTGVIEDNELFCVTGLVNTEELLECSGTGQFEIMASGFFDILAIPEIMCTGAGKPSSFDMGERFMSGPGAVLSVMDQNFLL